MCKLNVGACLAALVLGAGTSGFAFMQAANQGLHNKISITFASAPATVRAAILALTTEQSVKQISKETDARGRTTYEVAYDADGAAADAEINETGEVLEIAKPIDASALPTAVSSAIAAAYPSGIVKTAESKQVFCYEVILSVDGQHREVVVTADGQLSDDDFDDNDDDDDDDHDEDDGEDEDEDEDDDD